MPTELGVSSCPGDSACAAEQDWSDMQPKKLQHQLQCGRVTSRPDACNDDLHHHGCMGTSGNSLLASQSATLSWGCVLMTASSDSMQCTSGNATGDSMARQRLTELAGM